MSARNLEEEDLKHLRQEVERQNDADNSGFSFVRSAPEVAMWREMYRPDLVAGIVQDWHNPLCGVAQQFSGRRTSLSSFTLQYCVRFFTFTHEIGHNIGAKHSKSSPCPVVGQILSF